MTWLLGGLLSETHLTACDMVFYDIMIKNRIMTFLKKMLFNFSLLNVLFQSSFRRFCPAYAGKIIYFTSLSNNIDKLLTSYRKKY